MGERASAALSLPSPRAFFAFPFTERLFTTISEPGTGYCGTKRTVQKMRGVCIYHKVGMFEVCLSVG